MGVAVGPGTSGMAHRVQRDSDRGARRPDRHPLRRGGQYFPASRSRDRAKRRRDWQKVRELLVALRALAGRWPEDGEVPRKFLHGARRFGERLHWPRAALRADASELSDAAQFHLGWNERSARITRPD